MEKKVLVFLINFVFLSFVSKGQDSIFTYISIKDVAQMRYVAKNKVTTDLANLLNQITSSKNESADVKDIMKDSYTEGNRGRIFLNASINIEDDIAPTNKSTATSTDSKLDKYLHDLDVFYNKSNETSIFFTNERVSYPKRSQDGSSYVYIRVYYTSSFTGNYAEKEKAYSPNSRVADLRMVKEDGKWKPYIQSISFFSPEDTVQNFYENDIVISGNDSLTSTDSAALAASERNVMENEERQEMEKEREKRRKFNELMEKGNDAKERFDFAACRQFYKDAKDLYPLDPLPGKKMRDAKKVEDDLKLSKERVAEGYIKTATNEEKKRNYKQASKYYNKAIAENPDLKDKYIEKVKELDKKWLQVSLLDDKIESGTLDYKDLVDECSKAIKNDISNSDLYYERAKCYSKLDNLNKAINDCKTALDYDDKNLPALKFQAELYKKRNEKGDNFSAVQSYNQYKNIFEEDSTIYELLSDLRLVISPGAFEQAIEPLDEGLKIGPKWSHLYYKKGLLLVQKKDFQQAKENFNTAILNDSNYAFSYFERGKIEVAFKNISHAALDFEKARSKGLNAVSLEAIDSYSRSFFGLSKEKFNTSDNRLALNLVNDAISISPQLSEYYFWRGEYLFAEGKIDDAILSYSRAIALNNNYTEAWYKRGLANFERRDYSFAVQDYSKAVELDNRYLVAIKGVGDSYFALDKYTNAAQSYESFVRIANETKNSTTPAIFSVVYNSLGKNYFLINPSDERAYEAYKNAIRKDENYAEAYYNRGVYYHVKNELSDAIEDLLKSISLNNKNAGWYFELANTYQDKMEYLNAESYFVQTVALDSFKNYPKALYLAGKCHFQLENYTAALNFYQQVEAKQINKTINSFNYELGSIYLNLNKVDSAMPYIQTAFSIDSTNGNIIYLAAIAQLQKGNRFEAFRLFESAFKSGQLNQRQVRSDKLLANLKEDKEFKQLLKRYF